MPMAYIEACQRGAWHLEIWRRADPVGTRRRIVYKCRSWRHEGECRLWCGACDYNRCLAAIEDHDHWSFLTLTYPQKEWPRNRLDKLFRFGVVSWSRLRKRLVREFGSLKYIQTWEIHRRGWPHCHTLISSPGLYEVCDRRSWKEDWLEPAAVECGWGQICDISPMRSRKRMAGYLAKLARELTGSGVKSQVPVNAPRHFRRVRSSRHTLPPRHRDPEMTGMLHRSLLPELASGDAAYGLDC